MTLILYSGPWIVFHPIFEHLYSTLDFDYSLLKNGTLLNSSILLIYHYICNTDFVLEYMNFGFNIFSKNIRFHDKKPKKVKIFRISGIFIFMSQYIGFLTYIISMNLISKSYENNI